MRRRVASVAAIATFLVSMSGVHVAQGVPQTEPCAFPCFEDFDDGVFDHSSLQFSYPSGSSDPWPNLWHVSSVCADAPSPPNYLAFNQDSTCDYPEGVRTAGGIRLTVDLSGTTQAFLRYREFLQARDGAIWDLTSVRASKNGVDWITLVDASYERAPGWRTVGLDLSPLAGNPAVHIEWWFDTVDQIANWGVGWVLDDVRIDANPLCSGNDSSADACKIKVLPYGNHQFTSGFTLETDELGACAISGSTAWYEYKHSGPNSYVTVDTRGSDFDTVLGAFDGAVPVGCNDDQVLENPFRPKRQPQAVLSFPVVNGRTYRIQIGGYQGATGSLLVEVRRGLTLDCLCDL